MVVKAREALYTSWTIFRLASRTCITHHILMQTSHSMKGKTLAPSSVELELVRYSKALLGASTAWQPYSSLQLCLVYTVLPFTRCELKAYYKGIPLFIHKEISE